MPTGLETQLNNRQQEAPPAEPPVPGRRVSPRARWLAAGFAVLVLVALAVLTLIVTAAFILVPLALVERRAGPSGVRSTWLVGFAGLGLG